MLTERLPHHSWRRAPRHHGRLLEHPGRRLAGNHARDHAGNDAGHGRAGRGHGEGVPRDDRLPDGRKLRQPAGRERARRHDR